ncbi:uncharacterized protein J3D65DRAFT_53157 [Phyllosticta citribraziliensis]|uniref:Uncharacterized protein n=1 Tax=Phyllosticta citribraziliensis TaxID=989973 RepID=A0ABR1LC31_9PEZI
MADQSPAQSPVADNQSDPEQFRFSRSNIARLFGEITDAYEDLNNLSKAQYNARTDSQLAFNALTPEIEAHVSEVERLGGQMVDTVAELLEKDSRFQDTAHIAHQLLLNRDSALAAISLWNETFARLLDAKKEELEVFEKFVVDIKTYAADDEDVSVGEPNQAPDDSPAAELMAARAKSLRDYRITMTNHLIQLAIANERIQDEWRRALKLLPAARAEEAKAAYEEAKAGASG